MSSKIVLAINAGSSSVKVSVYDTDSKRGPEILAEAEVSGLSSPPPKFKYSCHGKEKSKGEEIGGSDRIGSQEAAFLYILETLLADKDLVEIQTKDNISLVAHRVVHGGDFSEPQTIDSKTMQRLEDLTDLAPLHNSSALEIVRTCTKQLPGSRNVAVFDSQFHQTIPSHVRTIMINQDIARKNGLRKYGFHGISYSFILRQTAEFLSQPVEETSIIALHLGSGASACVIQNGKSINTTMSLTPLDGLPGATRSGSVDPSLVFHYASNVGKLAPSSTKDLHISKAEQILNKESGWKTIAGTTDFGEIARRDTEEKKLAFDIFVDRITQYVGSYFVSLNGRCDALVFAGGIGEKSKELRLAVSRKLTCLNFHIDGEKNEAAIESVVQDISSGDETDRRILVCQTDEQLEMALACSQL